MRPGSKKNRLTSSPALPSRIPSPGTSSSNVHGSFWIQDVSNGSFLRVRSKDMWLQLTHLCICQDGVNIIVRHDDTSEYSCSVDRKVVRLRRVGNGARSRATRETGNWWRTRWHLLRTSTTTDGALRISVSFLSLDGCEKQTLAWQVGEIAQFLRWAIWHFRVITRCASYFTTEPVIKQTTFPRFQGCL